jgi:hypothetical protein
MSDDRKIKDESDRYIWISPKGLVFKALGLWGHEKFARKRNVSEDTLLSNGWIKCGTSCMGDYIFSGRKPCEKQIFVIFHWSNKYGCEKELERFCHKYDI